uniref:Uncharacterized protein n=1 Tax=Oryza sativa subsp. japonica TaxID=39947 RepID=Q6ZJE9_ORYSJ|nr:hypothetical protein [Oryza sativa Japonica Group]
MERSSSTQPPTTARRDHRPPLAAAANPHAAQRAARRPPFDGARLSSARHGRRPPCGAARSPPAPARRRPLPPRGGARRLRSPQPPSSTLSMLSPTAVIGTIARRDLRRPPRRSQPRPPLNLAPPRSPPHLPPPSPPHLPPASCQTTPFSIAEILFRHITECTVLSLAMHRARHDRINSECSKVIATHITTYQSYNDSQPVAVGIRSLSLC